VAGVGKEGEKRERNRGTELELIWLVDLMRPGK